MLEFMIRMETRTTKRTNSFLYKISSYLKGGLSGIRLISFPPLLFFLFAAQFSYL